MRILTEAISFVSSLRASRSVLRGTVPYGTPLNAWRLSDMVPTIERLLSCGEPYGLMGRNGRLAQRHIRHQNKNCGHLEPQPHIQTTPRWNDSEETPRGMESTGEIRSMAE